MDIELVLEACRIDPEDAQLGPETLDDLRASQILVQQARPVWRGGSLPHAATLVTAALGRIPRFNPTHLPFGFGGPRLKSYQWVDLDRIELILAQVIGLCHPDWDEQRVTFDAHCAISEATSLRLLEQKEYDGWVPGMRSGSGLRTAVSATPYGLVRARQAAKQLTPAPQQPPEDAHGESAPQPTQASAPAAQSISSAPSVPEPVLVEAGSNIVLLSAPPASLGLLAESRVSHDKAKWHQTPVGDRYGWARQVELVKAANQVLGDGELNPGVLSKACKCGHIATNGRAGRGSMASVTSFVTWLGRKRALAKEELDQVRNAIIGEISARP